MLTENQNEKILEALRKNANESRGGDPKKVVPKETPKKTVAPVKEPVPKQEVRRREEYLPSDYEVEFEDFDDDDYDDYREPKRKKAEKPRKPVRTETYEERPRKPIRKEIYEEEPEEPKKKKRPHVFRTLLIIVLCFFLALFGFGFLMASKVEYRPYEKIQEDPSWGLPGTYERGVMNILLIGTDARTEDDDSRADCIIVLSICPLQHKMYLTSILRDSYVSIPGYGQNRINHAYQMGGARLLTETIEQNFHIRIDHYAKVNFYSFIDIIDSLGGVTLDLQASEADYVNGYLAEINTLLGLPVDDQVIPVQDGPVNLNGKQALSYARIRYIGTDFARTERQRKVIQAVIKKLRKNPILAVKAVSTVLSSLQTDLKKVDIALLTMRAPFLLTYKMESNQVPFDGMWTNEITDSGQEVLGIDFMRVVDKLRTMIYK